MKASRNAIKAKTNEVRTTVGLNNGGLNMSFMESLSSHDCLDEDIRLQKLQTAKKRQFNRRS